MLSDEEKKAINDLNFIIVTDIYDNEVSIDKTKIINEYNKSVGIVLNLIEKQSKEIEELKSRNQEKTEALEEWINGERISIYCVHKDKIKAKIDKKFKEAKVLYERGVQPQAQYTMKLLRDLEKSLLEKE